jgi:hypothetical protein
MTSWFEDVIEISFVPKLQPVIDKLCDERTGKIALGSFGLSGAIIMLRTERILGWNPFHAII